MENSAIAAEVMESIKGLLGDVSDASIKMYAATLDPMKKGEESLGSLHNQETKRLFVLSSRLCKLKSRAKAQAALAETEEERDAENQSAGRFDMYAKLAAHMVWCQIHEDIGGFWADNTGLREDWLIVRLNEEDDPIEGMKSRLQQLFGGQLQIDTIGGD